MCHQEKKIYQGFIIQHVSDWKEKTDVSTDT